MAVTQQAPGSMVVIRQPKLVHVKFGTDDQIQNQIFQIGTVCQCQILVFGSIELVWARPIFSVVSVPEFDFKHILTRTVLESLVLTC